MEAEGGTTAMDVRLMVRRENANDFDGKNRRASCDLSFTCTCAESNVKSGIRPEKMARDSARDMTPSLFHT